MKSIITLLIALTFSPKTTWAADVSFEDSNCRVQSAVDPNSKSWSFISKVGDHPTGPGETDLEFKSCLEDQLSLVLMMVTDLSNGNKTVKSDHGVVEFLTPDRDSKQCSYFVKEGQELSQELQSYLTKGLPFNEGESYQDHIAREKKLMKEMENIVTVSCVSV